MLQHTHADKLQLHAAADFCALGRTTDCRTLLDESAALLSLFAAHDIMLQDTLTHMAPEVLTFGQISQPLPFYNTNTHAAALLSCRAR